MGRRPAQPIEVFMPKQVSGRRPEFLRPLDFKVSKWPKTTTLANHQSRTIDSPELSCGHDAAHTRHVERPNGPACYLCRRCFARLRAVEVRAIKVDRARR